MRPQVDVRPTRRGYGVALIAVLSLALLSLTGETSLQAIAVPALAAFAVGAVQLGVASPPSLAWDAPEPGFPNETRRVRVEVDPSMPCVVDERIGEGLAHESRFGTADHPPLEVGHGGDFEYSIRLESRGLHRIGPARCRQTDSLGLFARTCRPEDATSVLVYPEIYGIRDDLLAGLVARHLDRERGSFDRLREYRDGDTMRDIHWKASAKRPAGEFVVVEHEHFVEDDAVRIVAESDADGTDDMAAAVASLAVHLREAGVSVSVALPDEDVVEGPGANDRLLRTLALTDGGSVADERAAGADVHVRAEGTHTTVAIADQVVDFESAIQGSNGRVIA